MKIRKYLTLILIMLSASVGLLCGCGDKFAKLSAVIDKQEINYQEDGDNQFNVTLINLPDGSSAEVLCNAENPSVATFSVSVDQETKTSTISVSPNTGGSTNVSLIHKDSNKVLGKVKVNIIIPVETIEQNTYSPYVYVNENGKNPTLLNASKILNFNPKNTTQKDVIYSISAQDKVDGISVTEQGVLTATKYPTGGFVNVTATVKDTQVSTKIKVKVLMPINETDIQIKNIEDDKVITGNEPIILVNNRAKQSEISLRTTISYAGNDKIELSYSASNSLIEIDRYNSNEITVVSGDNVGNSYLIVKATIMGYEECFTTISVPFKVIQVPNTLSINGNEDDFQTFDIYNSYSNNLGQQFNINVGLSTANNLGYIIEISQEDAQNVRFVYNNGEVVKTVSNIEDATENDIALSNRFYVQCNNNANFDTTIHIKIHAYGGIGYLSPIQKTLILNLRKGVTEIKVKEENNFSNGIYYVEVGKSLEVDFSINNAEYSKEFLIETNTNYLSCDSNINGQIGIYNYSFTINAVAQGDTNLSIYASNGVKKQITVRSYIALENFTASTDSFASNQQIGDAEYKNLINNEIPSLSFVAVKVGSIITINVNKYDKNNQVVNNANIYNIHFSAENATCINVTSSGSIFARTTTEWDYETQTQKTEKVKWFVEYFTDNGIVVSEEQYFDVVVYRSIEEITLSNKSLDVYYSQNNNLYYYKDYLNKQISFLIKPSMATHYQVLGWEEMGIASLSERLLNVEVNNSDFSCKISANTSNLSSSGDVTTLYLQIKQFNKTYLKPVTIYLKHIDEISGIEKVTYSIGLNGKEQMLRDASEFNSTDHTVYDKYYNQDTCLGEIYVDYRDIKQSDSSIYLNIQIKNKPTFNDIQLYFLPKDNSYPAIEINHDNNSLINLNEGIGKLYFIPKTAYTVSGEYPGNLNSNDYVVLNEYLNSYPYAYIKVADGKTPTTAFELTTVDDLLKMNTVESLEQFRYYILKNDIDVSSISNWTAIGSNSPTKEFNGQLNGNNFTIKGLKLVKKITKNNECYGLFSKCSNQTLITNLNLIVENINISVVFEDDTYSANIGALCGEFAGSLINVNTLVKSSNLDFVAINCGTGNYISLNVGGIVGTNLGSVTDSKVSGQLNLTTIGGQNANQKLYVGGIAGINEGFIIGRYTHKNPNTNETNYDVLTNEQYNCTIDIYYQNKSTIINDVKTGFGGIAGVNKGTIKQIICSPTINALDNIGGIAGINKGTVENCNAILFNNIIENNSQVQYLSALSGNKNVGGVVGNSENASMINQVIVLLVDASNYYNLTNATIDALITGKEYVGGLVGYGENSIITQSYISSYFDRTIGIDSTNNVTYNGSLMLLENALSYAGGLCGYANNVAISECFANIDIYYQSSDNRIYKEYIGYGSNNTLTDYYSIINATTQQSKDNLNNWNGEILKNLTYFDKPTEITVSIKDGSFITEVDSNNAILYFYINDINKNIISIANLFEYRFTPETAKLINIFSTNENVIKFDITTNELQILKTGTTTLIFTSLLNNKLKVEINVVVLNAVSDNFGVYEDLYYSKPIVESGNDDKKQVTLRLGETKDIFVQIQTDSLENYFKTNGINYVYTAKDMYLQFSSNGSNVCTINGKKFSDNPVFNATDKLSIVASGENSGTEEITLELVAYVNGIYKTIKSVTFEVKVYRGIDAVKLSSTEASISSKDIFDLFITIESDLESETNIDLSVEVKSADSNDEQNYAGMFTQALQPIFVNKESNGNYVYKLSIIVNKESDLYKTFVSNNESKDFVIKIVAKDSDSITKAENTFNLTLNIQNVENISLNYFANAEQVKSSDSDNKIYTINEVPSTNIIAGTRGILKLNIYPEYSQIEKVQVKYVSSDPNNILSLEQMLLVSDGSKKVYSPLIPRAVDIENGIEIHKICANGSIDAETGEITPDDGDIENFEGNIYIGLSLGGNAPEGIVYTISVIVFDRNGNTYTKNISLTSSLKSGLTISYNDINNNIAVGTEHYLTVRAVKLVNNEEELNNIFFTDGGKGLPSGISITRYSYKQTATHTYEITYKIVITDTNLVTSTAKINAHMTKVVNKQTTTYITEETLNLNIQWYTINGFHINGLDNGLFKAAIGDNKQLSISLDVDYNVEMLLNMKDADEKKKFNSAEEVNDYIQNLSIKCSQELSNWYYMSNSNLTNYTEDNVTNENGVATQSPSDYYNLKKNSEYYCISARKKPIDTTIRLGVGFTFAYKEGEPNMQIKFSDGETINLFNNEHQEKLNNSSEIDYIYFKNDFIVHIYDSSSIENAVPISSYKEMLLMGEGGYYRLTNDIEIDEPFTPITTEVAYFDGNGYTISLKAGFNNEILTVENNENEIEVETVTVVDTLNLGLFDTVTANMKVYNVNLELPYLMKDIPVLDAGNKVKLNEDGNVVTTTIDNDFSSYAINTINIGGIAGVNYGVINNCSVSTSSKDDSSEAVKIDISTNAQSLLFIGGITGVNQANAYISNCRSNVVVAINHGNLGGLVAQNDGVISSSFYKSVKYLDDIVLSNNPTTEENSSLGGLVAINNGDIKLSFVEGCSKNGTRMANGYIQGSITIGAFVSKNLGTITDCYANIPVSGTAQTSGFVFDNSGEITNCYSSSKMKEKHNDHTPFVGTKKAGSLVQNTGSIVNSYYYDSGSDFATNLKAIAGVSKITAISKDNLKDFLFNSGGMENGVWKESVKNNESAVTLQEANRIATYQVENTGASIIPATDTEPEYTKYVWDFANSKKVAPYIIASVKDFNAYFNKDSEYVNPIDGKFAYDVVIARDLEFSKSEIPTSTDIIFSGTLYGNGMSLNGLYLTAGTEKGTNYGLFSSIENSLIKDLNININKLTANNYTNVGALAGEIKNSSICNINIDASNAVIQGGNFVGGLAGVIDNSGSTEQSETNSTDKFEISHITVTANINASYSNNIDINDNLLYNCNKQSETEIIPYSYVGGVAGVVKDAGVVNNEETSKSKFNNIVVYGNNKMLGFYVGGMFGYFGTNNTIDSSIISIGEENSCYIFAKRIAGGIVAHNNGIISNCQVIDNNKNCEFFKGAPNIIGGIVALNENGTIQNCVNVLSIVNPNSKIAGGIAGVALYGKIDGCESKCVIQSGMSAGGIVGTVTKKDSYNNSWFSCLSTKYSNDYELEITNCTVSESDLLGYSEQISVVATDEATTAVGWLIGSLQNGKEYVENVTDLTTYELCGSNNGTTIGSASQVN